MPKQAKFRPVKTAEGWRLNIPAKLTVSGRRERYFFRTKDEALAEAAKHKETRQTFGEQAAAISPSLAEQAVAAAALLKPFGISLLEAAQRIAGAEMAKAASVSVENALEAFEAAKTHLSDKQTAAIRHMAAHLREDFAGRQISTITAQEVATHLDARTSGPVAFNAKLRLLVTLWRWCARPPREWCAEDALAHVERKNEISGDVGVLTAAEVAKLMQTAEEYFPDTVVPFAISVFTGMRQAEIERLTPQDFTEDGITVPSSSAKTKRRRFIHMPEPLAEWLAKHPVGKTVCPANWDRKEKAVRRLAGWKVWSDLVPIVDKKQTPEPPANAPEWPQNALRHTAASVMLAMGKPLETLIFEHGHAGGVEMLRKHYIGRVTKKEAIAIWAIRPSNKKAKQTLVA